MRLLVFKVTQLPCTKVANLLEYTNEVNTELITTKYERGQLLYLHEIAGLTVR